jgi:hypothetical protein
MSLAIVKLQTEPYAFEDRDDRMCSNVAVPRRFGHSLRELVLKIDNERTHRGLSSAIRVHVLDYELREADAKA